MTHPAGWRRGCCGGWPWQRFEPPPNTCWRGRASVRTPVGWSSDGLGPRTVWGHLGKGGGVKRRKWTVLSRPLCHMGQRRGPRIQHSNREHMQWKWVILRGACGASGQDGESNGSGIWEAWCGFDSERNGLWSGGMGETLYIAMVWTYNENDEFICGDSAWGRDGWKGCQWKTTCEMDQQGEGTKGHRATFQPQGWMLTHSPGVCNSLNLVYEIWMSLREGNIWSRSKIFGCSFLGWERCTSPIILFSCCLQEEHRGQVNMRHHNHLVHHSKHNAQHRSIDIHYQWVTAKSNTLHCKGQYRWTIV